MEGCYYRKGASVIYHYKEWRRVMWSDSGYGWGSAWKRCKVVCTPRNAYGQFTTDNCDMEFVTLKDENGRIFQASMEDVEPDRDIETLSREELVKLWGEVCKGSIYLCDYRNSLGVFEYVASDWYDAFWEYLSREYGEKAAEEKDTAENFADYVLFGECA